MPIRELLAEARQNKDHEAVCRLYDQWQTEGRAEELSQWDYLHLMNGLYGLKRYEDCLELYKLQKQAWPESDLLHSKMGWCVYHLYIKPVKKNDFDKKQCREVLKKADYVLKLVRQEDFSPLWLIVDVLSEGLMGGSLGGQKDFALALHYLDLVQPESLSAESGETMAGNKKISLASPKEKWYCRRVKCLCELARYEECVAFGEEALKALGSFHNNSDSWIKQRMAVSLAGLQQFEQAEKIANEIVRSGFRNWNIFHLLFGLACREEKFDDAFKYAGMCAVADNSHEMRVRFYGALAEFLDSQGREREAMLHRQLIDALRQEKNWKQKKDENWQLPEEIAALSKADVLKELKPWWWEWWNIGRVFASGRIEKILPNGSSGFIRGEDGRSFYFSFKDARCRRDKLQPEAEVRFALEERLDRKKNQWKENAVEITVP